MKFRLVLLSLSMLLLAQPLVAGVVFTLETKTSGKSGDTEVAYVFSDGQNLKMNANENGEPQEGTVIYHGDKREMVVVNEKEKSFMVMDLETMKSLAGQVSQAMNQMQEALKNVPESQRAMMEKMLKDKMPASQQAAVPEFTVKATGKKGKHHGYNCEQYQVFEDKKLVREMWVTDWSNVKGGQDVASSFQSIGEFFEELMSAINIPGAGKGLAQMKNNMFAQMKEIKGFPVVNIEFNDSGAVEKETHLVSADQRNLSKGDFQPPAGYKQQQMFPKR